MPIAFLVFGLILVIASVRGKEQTDRLLGLLKKDFAGPNNFFIWAFGIGGVAALGYVDELKPLSRSFLVLIFIALLLVKKDGSGKDFFTSFLDQLKSTEATPGTDTTVPSFNIGGLPTQLAPLVAGL